MGRYRNNSDSTSINTIRNNMKTEEKKFDFTPMEKVNETLGKHVEGIVQKEEVQKRKGSTSTTIKSFNGVIEKLYDLKMTTPDEHLELMKLKQVIVGRWLSMEMGIEVQQSGETTK